MTTAAEQLHESARVAPRFEPIFEFGVDLPAMLIAGALCDVVNL
jgi:hypothetical protein